MVVALLGVLRAEAACSHDVAERGLAMHLAKKAALEKQQHRRHILDSRDTVSRHGKQTRSGFSKRQGPGSLAAQEQMLGELAHKEPSGVQLISADDAPLQILHKSALHITTHQ